MAKPYSFVSSLRKLALALCKVHESHNQRAALLFIDLCPARLSRTHSSSEPREGRRLNHIDWYVSLEIPASAPFGQTSGGSTVGGESRRDETEAFLTFVTPVSRVADHVNRRSASGCGQQEQR